MIERKSSPIDSWRGAKQESVRYKVEVVAVDSYIRISKFPGRHLRNRLDVDKEG